MANFTQWLSWFKDVSTIIFAGTGTVVAILTYKRARATVLQPKRNEVIKIQTQILTDFLKTMSANGTSIDSEIDYFSVLNVNMSFKIWRHNSKMVEQDEMFVELNKLVGGYYLQTPYNLGKYSLVYGDFKALIEFVQQNNVEPIIILTYNCLKTFNLIKELSNNPILPNDMVKIFVEIREQINFNLGTLMPQILKNLDTNPIAKNYHNEFEQKRMKHNVDFNELKDKIRHHLGVDDKW